MVLALLAACLATQDFNPKDPRLDQRVTMRVDAAGLPDLVKAIGKGASLSLTADDRLRKQILVVAVNDVRLGDLLDKVATVADCTWTEEGGGFVLRDSPAKKAKTGQDDAKE